MIRFSRVALLALLAACGSDDPVEEPVPVSASSPVEFPIALWDQGAEGEALLMLHINELGAVDSAYVVESSGYEAFDSAALRGARKLQFRPGRRGDRRIDMWAKLPVRFTREHVLSSENPEALP